MLSWPIPVRITHARTTLFLRPPSTGEHASSPHPLAAVFRRHGKRAANASIADFARLTIDPKSNHVVDDFRGAVITDGHFSFAEVERLAKCVSIKKWRGIGAFNGSGSGTTGNNLRVSYRTARNTNARPPLGKDLVASFGAHLTAKLARRVSGFSHRYGVAILRTERVCKRFHARWKHSGISGEDVQQRTCADLNYLALQMASAASLGGKQPVAVLSDLHAAGGTFTYSLCKPCDPLAFLNASGCFALLPNVCDVLSLSGPKCALVEMAVAGGAATRIRSGHSQLHQFIQGVEEHSAYPYTFRPYWSANDETANAVRVDGLTYSGGWVVRTPTIEWLRYPNGHAGMRNRSRPTVSGSIAGHAARCNHSMQARKSAPRHVGGGGGDAAGHVAGKAGTRWAGWLGRWFGGRRA